MAAYNVLVTAKNNEVKSHLAKMDYYCIIILVIIIITIHIFIYFYTSEEKTFPALRIKLTIRSIDS